MKALIDMRKMRSSTQPSEGSKAGLTQQAPFLVREIDRTSSIQDSLSGTGSQIISFYAVREGLVPWDWLFLEKLKSIRNLGGSIRMGCWFGRDGSNREAKEMNHTGEREQASSKHFFQISHRVGITTSVALRYRSPQSHPGLALLSQSLRCHSNHFQLQDYDQNLIGICYLTCSNILYQSKEDIRTHPPR
ncbi:hypothetical protein L484_023688 [Morus notabilis]|uniref:Uncharacterized protein n=1 Tax=Morus notabilis TaxID=981085 RepID=W9RPE9_9ROSA|nr:hypothetical protein L484_023688 [Morus notabilis]